MGLKCSVLGHKFDEDTIERDREEQGSEVVITIREIETCTRCGTERVVSENKEVTTIDTPDEVETAPEESAADAGDGSGADATDEPTDEADGDVGGPAGAGADAAAEEGPESTADGADVDESAPMTDAEGGAEIIDAEGDAAEAADDELADPSIETEPDDPDPAEEDEDAVIMGEDETDDDEGERAPGEWPEEPDPEETDWTPDEPIDGTSTDPRTAPDEGDTSAVTVPSGQYRCPGCGFTTDVESTSLRAGDFCPECRTETLVHEPGEQA